MRSPETTSWHAASWQSRPAQQQPTYVDPVALERAVAHISRLPPIVVSCVEKPKSPFSPLRGMLT